jgi:hypothetical protein
LKPGAKNHTRARQPKDDCSRSRGNQKEKKPMRKLGILVSTSNHMDHLLGILRAARSRDVETIVFLSHKGVLLTQDRRLPELLSLAGHFALCNVGFEANGLEKPVAGIEDRAYATQARHVELIENCDRYLKL